MDLPPSAAPLRALPAECLPPAVLAAVHAWPAGEETSAYFYDLSVAARNAAALRACLPAWAELCYAVKANGFPPVLDALLAGADPPGANPAESCGQPGRGGRGGVDGFEVSSVREARLAQAAYDRAGAVGLRRLVASGPAKSVALLTALAQSDGAVVNVESVGELRRLNVVAAHLGRRVAVAVRVNPARVDLTGSLQMGGRPSAFGIPEPEVPAVLELAAGLAHVDVVGFHVHAVSANLDAAAHLGYVRWCLDFAVRTASAAGVDLRLVDMGGGFGVPFEPDRRGEVPFDLARFGDGLADLRIPPGVRAIFEPGRLLVADCGWYAAQVIDVKRSYGTDFVVLRGGIHHFALPTSWEIVHNFAVVPRSGQAVAATASPQAALGPPDIDPPDIDPPDIDPPDIDLPDIDLPDTDGRPVTVVGELCTPEDTLARDVTVGPVRPGDAVVFPMAGAYGYEFALADFLSHPRPQRIVLDAGGDQVRTVG